MDPDIGGYIGTHIHGHGWMSRLHFIYKNQSMVATHKLSNHEYINTCKIAGKEWYKTSLYPHREND